VCVSTSAAEAVTLRQGVGAHGPVWRLATPGGSVDRRCVEEGMSMPSDREKFWTHESFAVVGHTAARGFPKLTFGALREQGRRVFAVDPSVGEIDGVETYPDLESLPEKVEAAVLEVPKEETEDWVRKAADAGIRHVWIHMNRDTPEALALAKQRGLDVLTGTCAVMYVEPGFTYHTLHKWVSRLTGQY
jgi:predicted CoA-binding protein